MRHGQLLVEKSPRQLMTLHQSVNLEEIFLDVCKKQDGLQDAIDLQDKVHHYSHIFYEFRIEFLNRICYNILILYIIM